MVRVISGDAWTNEVCALRRAPDGSHISHEPSFTDMGSPATGYPADSGLRGVTVIDSCSTKADALTTALFVMGLDKGMKFCEENEIAAVFITSDKQVYTTSKTGDCTFEFLGEKKGYTYAE